MIQFSSILKSHKQDINQCYACGEICQSSLQNVWMQKIFKSRCNLLSIFEKCQGKALSTSFGKFYSNKVYEENKRSSNFWQKKNIVFSPITFHNAMVMVENPNFRFFREHQLIFRVLTGCWLSRSTRSASSSATNDLELSVIQIVQHSCTCRTNLTSFGCIHSCTCT